MAERCKKGHNVDCILYHLCPTKYRRKVFINRKKPQENLPGLPRTEATTCTLSSWYRWGITVHFPDWSVPIDVASQNCPSHEKHYDWKADFLEDIGGKGSISGAKILDFGILYQHRVKPSWLVGANQNMSRTGKNTNRPRSTNSFFNNQPWQRACDLSAALLRGGQWYDGFCRLGMVFIRLKPAHETT